MNDFTNSQRTHAVRRHISNAKVFMKLIIMYPGILTYWYTCSATYEGVNRILSKSYESVQSLPRGVEPSHASQSSEVEMAAARPERNRKYPMKIKEVKRICKKQTKISYFPRCLLSFGTSRTVFFDGGWALKSSTNLFWRLCSLFMTVSSLTLLV